MYTKHEAAQLRQAFWTGFGQYMLPVPSAEGAKINWLNYKTGVKDLYFKMEAGNGTATIAIVLMQPDVSRQTFYFNRFKQVRNLLQDALQEEWEWLLHKPDENNKTTSIIYKELNEVSIFKKDDWPAIIAFFKPRMIALDAFWNDVKSGFDGAVNS